MEHFLRWLADHWISIGLGLSLVVQITPIKWSPWTSLFKWIGKLITNDLTKKVDALSASVNKLQKDMDENEKDRIRNEVLSFANECRRHIDHTKEEFDHIISLKSKYDAILKRTGDENGVFAADYAYINDIYQNCLRDNSFL